MTTPRQLYLSTLLTFTIQTILHEMRNEKHETKNNSYLEFEFTVQSVSVLIMHLFLAQKSISFR